MADPLHWQGPLEALGIADLAAGDGALGLEDREPVTKVVLRGRSTDRVFLATAKAAMGAAPPLEANKGIRIGRRHVLWLGPDEWLILAAADDGPALESALDAGRLIRTEVSEGRTMLAVVGPRARDVLAKGTSLDLRPAVFGAGRCAQTRFAQIALLIYRPSDRDEYVLVCERSFAPYLHAWLEDAGHEFGLPGG